MPKIYFTDLLYLLFTLIIEIIMIVIIKMRVIIITHYSKFQFNICVNTVIGFLKMMMMIIFIIIYFNLSSV